MVPAGPGPKGLKPEVKPAVKEEPGIQRGPARGGKKPVEPVEEEKLKKGQK
jgi:hypothetical protein